MQAMVAASHNTMNNVCPHCGGGKCLGVCGSSLAKLRKKTCCGHIILEESLKGSKAYIVPDGSENSMRLTLNPASWTGRMILRACPPGVPCDFVVLVNGASVEKLISAKKRKS